MPELPKVADLATMLRRLRETLHLMVGLPDYDYYVAHRRRRHPGGSIMSRADFVRDRTARRYAGRGSGRCC